jgi:pilus assembly protein CpaB
MKRAQLIVAGLAVVAGIGAFMLSGGKPKTVIVEKQVQAEAKGPPMDEILVATKNVSIGSTLDEKNMAWRPWPKDSVAKTYVSKAANPKGLDDYKGALTRNALLSGDPINTARVAKGERGGVMAALLPEGMRAIAVPISPETGAGGFILPNDRVDVLLTRKERATNANGRDNVVSETILPNVRVMAIDQTIQEKDGEKVVVGRTATLELSPRQAETLSMAKQLGELSLTLRSLADSAKANPSSDATPSLNKPDKPDDSPGSMTIIRFGVSNQVPMSR